MSKHRWLTNRDTWEGPETTNPEHEFWDDIDIFAFESGYCNGPRCKDCGRTGCHRCEPEMYDEDCPAIIDTQGQEQ